MIVDCVTSFGIPLWDQVNANVIGCGADDLHLTTCIPYTDKLPLCAKRKLKFGKEKKWEKHLLEKNVSLCFRCQLN